MTYTNKPPEPWAAPADWGDWVRQPRAAKCLDISVDFLTTVPNIRRRKVSHKTVLLNVEDLVAWMNADIRSRYIAPPTAAEQVWCSAKDCGLGAGHTGAHNTARAKHRRYGAVVPAAEQVA